MVLERQFRHVFAQVADEVIARFTSFNSNNDFVRAQAVVNLLGSDHLNSCWKDLSHRISKNVHQLSVRTLDNDIAVFLEAPECLDELTTLVFIETSRWLIEQHNT